MKYLLIAILIMSVIFAVLAGLMINKGEGYRLENVQLKARNDMLEISLNEKDKIIKAQKNDIIGLNQELEQLSISNQANEMFIYTVTEDYKQALRYIDMAEYILGKQGIDYYYIGRRNVVK